MSSLEKVSEQIEKESFFWPFTDERAPDLKDHLLEFASDLRQRDCRYQIEYFRPDQPDFRLRSKQSPPSDAPSETIHFLDPGRRLHIEAEGLDESTFQGIAAELTILGETDQLDEDSGRESELNLLTARTFQAELYAEFQRWERYDSPFGISVIRLVEDSDWKAAARELKHVGSRRDLFGLISSTFLMGFFPSRSEEEFPAEPLQERLQLRYEPDEIHYQFFHIPTDCSDWSQLQERISELENIKECDFVGSHED